MRSVGWARHFLWSILGLLSANNLGKTVETCLTVENCETGCFGEWGASCLLYYVEQYFIRF